ncbi:MAG: RNA polymerase sporulation sigma factor SigK [Oscillospiraceae bacterium]|nr:RNA polymerase sporulation sigma factor SigK [Oscillospiraceae bacterium]
MIFTLLGSIFSNLIYFALHVTNTGSFPKPLTVEEEQDLLIRMQQGDDEARKQLIEHNLRLVAHIIKKYYNSSVEQDDLISIGTIGLIKAVSTFNSNKGIRLATYAARCIENEVLMYFRNLKKSAQDVFISDPIDTDKEGNSLTLLDVISDDSCIADDIDLKIKLEKLQKYIGETLTERERIIIELRYGIGGRSELTQREVAGMLDISRSYVSRIEKKALEKLKNRFDSYVPINARKLR